MWYVGDVRLVDGIFACAGSYPSACRSKVLLTHFLAAPPAPSSTPTASPPPATTSPANPAPRPQERARHPARRPARRAHRRQPVPARRGLGRHPRRRPRPPRRPRDPPPRRARPPLRRPRRCHLPGAGRPPRGRRPRPAPLPALPVLRLPHQALLQEPAQGAHLLAAGHPLRRLCRLALLPPGRQGHPLQGAQRLRAAQAPARAGPAGRLAAGAGDAPTAGQRKAMEAQARCVEELQTFRDEVARVAPLWDPDRNDGVSSTCPPLAAGAQPTWQAECRTAWDALCRGDYDWSHLACACGRPASCPSVAPTAAWPSPTGWTRSSGRRRPTARPRPGRWTRPRCRRSSRRGAPPLSNAPWPSCRMRRRPPKAKAPASTATAVRGTKTGEAQAGGTADGVCAGGFNADRCGATP